MIRIEALGKLVDRLGWSVARVDEIKGGYAAKLYRVQAVRVDGERVRAVYKQLAPGRTAEIGLYRELLPEVPHGIPELYGTVEEADEQGILVEDAGEVVKPLFQRESLEGKQAMLRAVVGMLAELHVALEEKSREWVAAGKTGTYPFASSEEWGTQAIRELEWLAGEGLFGVDAVLVEEMRAIAGAFYPRYPEWTNGRTTFTHGDPHMENVLLDRGRYRLIDWEWACVSLPQRDLSILLQDVLDEELHEYAWG
ncbi:MAG: phosphotransferase family protein, partial [Tumebacillaceae bacterium]